MQTLRETPKNRNPKACYAFLDDVHGLALLAPDRTVHFRADATGLWQALTNADAPRLTLLGHVGIIEAQRMADERFGSLYALIEYRNTEHARVRRAA